MEFIRNPPKRLVVTIAVVVAVIVIINFLLFGYTHSWFSTKVPTPTPTPTPTLIPEPTATPTPRPIPHGKKGFSVSSAKKTGPQFDRGFVDPYDPPSGGKQIVSVTLRDSSPIATVTATLKSDHEETSALFTRVEGTDTDGRWEAHIEYKDSYLYTYLLKIDAVDTVGEKNEVELTLR